MNDAFSRLTLLVPDFKEKVKNKIVLIIGLGGVGGYALEAMARLGIEKFILVDGDCIEESNLNRQLIATTCTIGKMKVKAWEDRLLTINPNISIIKIPKFITLDNIHLLFEHKISFFIDACDTVAVKKEIIKICTKEKIPFITSMGMGKKLDPAQVKITKLSSTSYDPIARILRKYVKENNIKEPIMTVSSTEAPVQIDSNVIASNAVVPAVAGLLIADYVWKQLLKENVL